MKKIKILTLGIVMVGFMALQANADVGQVKLYKQAFPGSAPKCMACHLDKTPKKDKGKHELNEYGLKVKKEAEKPTADTYKKVGKAEEKK